MNVVLNALLALDLENFFSNVLESGVVAVLLLIVALIAASIARSIAKKLTEAFFAKRVSSEELTAQKTDTVNLIGNIAYAVVFMLFLPGALDKLGVSSVSQPISTMVTKLLSYLPNIIAAGLVVIFGIFLAKLVKQILTLALKKTNVDNLQTRAGIKVTNNSSISEIIGTIAYAFLIIVFVIAALQILNLEAISKPATDIINSLLGYVPSLFAAIILVAVGVFLGRLAAQLLDSVLKGTGVDETATKLFPAGAKTSFSTLASQVVEAIIVIFFVVSAINVLNIDVLSNIGNAVIAYLPNVIAAALIGLIATLGGSKAEELVTKANPNSAGFGKVLKFGIYTLATVMVLTQLGIATDIVSSAFKYLVLAAAVAFALAFGLGGRDWAAKKLNEVDRKNQQ